MTAYPESQLHHLFIREQVAVAQEEGCLSNAEGDILRLQYPVTFYTPDLFIRIGLFILTAVILLFTFGLIILLFETQIGSLIGTLTVIFGAMAYAALEYFVQKKRHYLSGVDDALLYISCISIFLGVSLPNHLSPVANCALALLISGFAVIRFADRLMAAVALLSFAGIVFYSVIQWGPAARASVPLVIMGLAAILYRWIRRSNVREDGVYRNCGTVAEILSLILLYASCNYFVVRELCNEVLGLHLQPGQSMPYSWFYWSTTVLIPIIYIGSGIRQKNRILIRAGLLLVAAMIITIRYYKAVMPVETLMAISGLLMIFISWILTRYLRTDRQGFTASVTRLHKEGLQAESLIIAETFSTQPGVPGGHQPGGGSFGGGGASGEY